jgi:hypothetical protein
LCPGTDVLHSAPISDPAPCDVTLLQHFRARAGPPDHRKAVKGC